MKESLSIGQGEKMLCRNKIGTTFRLHQLNLLQIMLILLLSIFECGFLKSQLTTVVISLHPYLIEDLV